MAVGLAGISSMAKAYRSQRYLVSVSRVKANIVNSNFENGKLLSANEAFKAALEKIILQNKIWEDFLEKLRKSGGGGGGGLRRIDRIAVSFMLSNFLNNKIMQALIQSFNNEFLKLVVFGQGQNEPAQKYNIFSGLVNSLNTNGKTGIAFVIRQIQSVVNIAIKGILAFNKQVTGLLEMLSFHLNKLKELLESEFKEAVRKLNFKEKIRKAKEEIIFKLDFARID